MWKQENINNFYIYKGLSSNLVLKLSDLNNKDDTINISVYAKNESEQKSNIIMPDYLKFHESNHIICPKCKGISEIDINNFKISIKNCNFNHTMPYLFLNDFINTQFVDESQIKCKYCNKSTM